MRPLRGDMASHPQATVDSFSYTDVKTENKRKTLRLIQKDERETLRLIRTLRKLIQKSENV